MGSVYNLFSKVCFKHIWINLPFGKTYLVYTHSVHTVKYEGYIAIKAYIHTVSNIYTKSPLECENQDMVLDKLMWQSWQVSIQSIKQITQPLPLAEMLQTMPDYTRRINTIHPITVDKPAPSADTLPLSATSWYGETVIRLELANTNGLCFLNKGLVMQSALLALGDFEAVVESSRLAPRWPQATYSSNAPVWLNLTWALTKSQQQSTTGY